jgi:hypothetical protein
MLQAFEQATGGGAPQPAESTASVRRIAADGQAYTWEQFVEQYGTDAQRCWDEAYAGSMLRQSAFAGRGGAPQPAESTADVRRIAADGQAYTWEQFVEAYGTDAQRCWNDAHDQFLQQHLVRTALDGNSYTFTQYAEQYGADARRFWDDASQLAVNANAEPEWNRVKPTPAIDEEDAAANQMPSIPEERRANQWTGCSRYDDSDASQLAVNAPSDGQPQPHENAAAASSSNSRGMPHTPCPTRACPGAETTTAQCLPLPSVCTFQQMEAMQKVKGIGGKTACAKQRELRKVCMDTGVFEIDVTETWPEWKAVLRALPPNMQRLIIGDGIAMVKFRLLQGIRDPNYAKIDSGERHVFEMVRVDTSAVQLHYHKNGTMDDPVQNAPTCEQWRVVMPQNASSGASHPTAPFIAPSPETPSASQPVIGRREAVLALTAVLNACWQHKQGAVDITDEVGFAWRRFFANTMENLQIAAMDIDKVFALRTADSGSPKLAVCTTGTDWKVLDPNQAVYKNARRPGLQDMFSNWREDPLLSHPQVVPANWMRMM